MKKLLLSLCILFMMVLCACEPEEKEATSSMFYDKLIGDVYESTDNVKLVLAAEEDTFQFEPGFNVEQLCYSDDGDFLNLKDDGSLNSVEGCYCITDNEVVYASNIYEKVYPASITKLMTALLTLEKCDLTESVTITDTGAENMPVGAKNCEFVVGETLTVEALLNSLLIYSGNDAAYILAVHIAGSESAFVEMMNNRAKELFANYTHYVNPHGLNNINHYTTPYDMYLVFNECLKHEKFREIISTPKYDAYVTEANGETKIYEFEQTNAYFLGLAKPPEGITVKGGKTGTTSAAGYCNIMLFEGVDGKEYICESFGNYTAEELYRSLDKLMEMTLTR